MKSQNWHFFSLIVNFEDVDINGVVHHPNYLKYLERARSYMIRQSGYPLEKLLSSGTTLSVSEIHVKYLIPARLEQELFVISQVTYLGKSIVKISQFITTYLPSYEELSRIKEGVYSLAGIIFGAQVELVCVDLESAKLKSIPPEFKQALTINESDLSKTIGVKPRYSDPK
jgi:acyl-CoA thioester hydrolase